MEYYSAIKMNKIMPLAAKWMDLEILILSETNVTCYCLYAESQKNGTNELIYNTEIESQM